MAPQGGTDGQISMNHVSRFCVSMKVDNRAYDKGVSNAKQIVFSDSNAMYRGVDTYHLIGVEKWTAFCGVES